MCYVRIGVESVSLRRKKFKHAHKAGSWYILGVLLKISIMHPVLFIYELPQGDFPKLQHGDNAISCRPGSTRTFLDCSVPYFPVISCISIVEFDRSGRIQNARGRRDRGGHHASNPPPRSHASSPLPPGDRQLQSHGKRGDCEWSSTFREPGAFIDLYTN